MGAEREVISRIPRAKLAFSKMKGILTSKNINSALMKQLVSTFFCSMLLYGMEVRHGPLEQKNRDGFKRFTCDAVGGYLRFHELTK